MKRSFFLILISFFISAEDFKSWEAEFIFSLNESRDFDMKRKFLVNAEEISSSFIIRPLVIFKYSQNSSLLIDSNEVRSVATEVRNTVPGQDIRYFKVNFENNVMASQELNFSVERDEKILDQLGSDLQMRLNAKKGIKDFKLLVIDNDKGDVVERTYKTLGVEMVETDFGEFECIKISATSLDAGRIIYFISPELDFMIIKSFVELRNGEINSLILIGMPKFLEE